MSIIASFKTVLIKIDIDRAVFLGISTRIWSFITGPVTAILIAKNFTSELQGYYYTFNSLLAFQVFVELGLSTVIIQFASHEWSSLSINEEGFLVGKSSALSRLKSLAKFAVKWYLVAGIILPLILGVAGFFFFSKEPGSSINWVAPWLILCLFTGTTICLIPLWSLLEGCNQITNVYSFRFYQGLLRSLAIWIVILLGHGLWAMPIAVIISLIFALVFLKQRYWNYFQSLFGSSTIFGSQIGWRSEILSMQWRIATSWLSGYFVFSTFTPILFYYHGPVIAGQMGMTWSLVMAFSTLAGVWVRPKAPRFGMLIAQKKYNELDRLFWRLAKIVSVVSISGALIILSFVYFINNLNLQFANRLLPIIPTGLFLLATVIMTISLPMSTYLRAHKREPLMILSVISGVLIAVSNIILGKLYSANGMAVGYLIINCLIIPFVVLVWYRCRISWHT